MSSLVGFIDLITLNFYFLAAFHHETPTHCLSTKIEHIIEKYMIMPYIHYLQHTLSFKHLN